MKGAYSGAGSVQRPEVGGNRFCSENGGLGKGPTMLGLESSAPWEQQKALEGSKHGLLWYYGATVANGDLPLNWV